jgi:transcriptional regulator with XRE-family HTH domain
MPRIKTDQERGYVAAWMRRERSARGWSQKDMPSRLATVGFPVEADYYRQIEAGPKMPGPDFLGALKRLYGSEPEPLPAPQSTDGLAELAAAIREQTDVNRQLVTAVGQLALVMHQDRHEAPDWFVERGDEWTALVLDTIRQTLGVAAGAGLPGSDAPRPVSTPPGPADNEPAGSRGKR